MTQPGQGPREPSIWIWCVLIIIGALFFFFPLLAIFTSLNALFENLFDINFYRTFLTAAIALVIVWSVVLTGRLVLINGPRGFGTPPTECWQRAFPTKGSFWAVVLALPSLFVQLKIPTLQVTPATTGLGARSWSSTRAPRCWAQLRHILSPARCLFVRICSLLRELWAQRQPVSCRGLLRLPQARHRIRRHAGPAWHVLGLPLPPSRHCKAGSSRWVARRKG
jgi:hypothetical protein